MTISKALKIMIATMISFIAASIADIPQKPQVIDYVFDYANLLTPEQVQKIHDIGLQLDNLTSAELVVITIPTLDGMPIQDYSLALANAWGIGKKDKNNGCLLLAVADNLLKNRPGRVRIEVGRGLEGCLNDAKCGRILDELFLPPFLDDTASTETRGKAIVDSFTFLAQEIAKESNVTLELDEPVTLPCKVTDDMDSFWAFFKVGLMFLILLFARFSRYFRGHSYGTHGGVRSHGGFGGGGRSFGGGHFGGGGAHR